MKFVAGNYLLVFLAIASCECSDFSWKQCSLGDDAALQIRDFGFAPDPVRLDAYVAMNMRSEVTKNVTYPLTLSMTIRKVTVFFGWEMRIPCMPVSFGLPYGSCEYDVCSAMAYLESTYGCPSEFTNNRLQCSCPFTAAAYSTADTEPVRLFIDTSFLPSLTRIFLPGRYRVTAKVLDGNSMAMCIEFTMRLTK